MPAVTYVRKLEPRKVEPFVYAVIARPPGEDEYLVDSGITAAKNRTAARAAIMREIDLGSLEVSDIEVKLLPFDD
jgi:hypothetical protein